MEFLPLELKRADWPIIRQGLSLALLCRVPVRLVGALRFFNEIKDYLPLLEDLRAFLAGWNAGEISMEGEDLAYQPSPVSFGSLEFNSGAFASAAEILLFAAPVLFHQEFRSRLRITGVTHSPLSCSTGFLKETLFGLLEGLGFYAGLSLRRFGFHGTGAGELVFTAYPREKAMKGNFSTERPRLLGAKVIVSRCGTELAEREKSFLLESLDLPEGRVSVIDVMDAAGYGNSLQVHAQAGALTMVFSRDISFYNGAGELVFDDDQVRRQLQEVIGEAKDCLAGGPLPEYLSREMVPYQILAGEEITDRGCREPVLQAEMICRRILGERT